MGEYIEPPAADTPIWNRLMNQLGKGLNDVVAGSPWCQDNGLETGGDYLKMWLAFTARLPETRLPVLAMHGGDIRAISLLSLAFSIVSNWTVVVANDLMNASRSHMSHMLGGLSIAVADDIPFLAGSKARRLLKRFATNETIMLQTLDGLPSPRRNFTRWIVSAPFRAWLGPENSKWITPFYVKDYGITTEMKQAALAAIESESLAIVVQLYNFDLSNPYTLGAMPALSGAEVL